MLVVFLFVFLKYKNFAPPVSKRTQKGSEREGLSQRRRRRKIPAAATHGQHRVKEQGAKLMSILNLSACRSQHMMTSCLGRVLARHCSWDPTRQCFASASLGRHLQSHDQRTPLSRTLSMRAQHGEPFADAVKRLQLKFVLFSWTDLFGVMRSKLVPASAAAEVADAGAGFAGFAAHLDLQPSDPDVLAFPDASSLVKLPWKREVGWVACDLQMGGKQLTQSPRNALKHVQASLKNDFGLSMKTGVELEFHLLSGDDTSRLADSKDVAAKPCYQVEPLMRQYSLISELMQYMEELGWEPYQADHEDSIGQFEINWTYDDALITADRHVFYKWMVKEAAAQRGLVIYAIPCCALNLHNSSEIACARTCLLAPARGLIPSGGVCHTCRWLRSCPSPSCTSPAIHRTCTCRSTMRQDEMSWPVQAPWACRHRRCTSAAACSPTRRASPPLRTPRSTRTSA